MNLKELKEKALRLTENAQEKIIEIKNKAMSMKDSAGEKVNQAKDKVEEVKENSIDLKNQAEQKVDELKEKAETTKNDVTQKANQIKDNVVEVKEKATSKVNEVKDKADNLKNETEAKINETKEKAEELKNSALEKKDETIKKGKEGFFSIKFGVNTKEELDFIIKKSATTSHKNPETGEEKFYKHKSMVIFAQEGSDFLKKAYYIVPVIVTKAFSQNISVKLAKSKIEGVNLKDYNIDEANLPCIVIFEEEKYLKTIAGEENILKLVKSLDLDINKLIEEA